MNWRTLCRMALILGLATHALPSPASALVLDPTNDKDALKLRNDINKQGAGFTACLIKAVSKCEQKGADPVGSECDLINPAGSTIADAKAKDKFIAAVDKCKSKVDYNKANKFADATAGYVALGCPGDCDAGPTTDPRGTCSDLTTWGNFSKVSTPGTIQGVAVLVPVLSACATPAACMADPGACPVPAPPADPMNPTKDELKAAAAFKKCIEGKVGVVGKLVGAVQKCQTACETDYKDKKGNGGPTDTAVCAYTTPENTNANFKTCIDKAYGTAIKKGPLPNAIVSLIPTVQGLLNRSLDNSFNNDTSLCP